MRFLKFIFFISFLFLINWFKSDCFREYDDVPGQFGLDNYISIMKEGIPQKINDLIYDWQWNQKIQFKNFIPRDFWNSVSKSKDLEYIDVKYKTMLRILKEKDWNTESLNRLSNALNWGWELYKLLLLLIKSNEWASVDKNPWNNDQWIYQMYSYEMFRKWGCKWNNYYYTSCSVANSLYKRGKPLSEYEQYLQLADFIMFLENKKWYIDVKVFRDWEDSIFNNTNFALQSLWAQSSLNEVKYLFDKFDKKNLQLLKDSQILNFFAKNQLILSEVNIKNVDDLSEIFKMYYVASQLLWYNGFRYWSSYLDNPYVASLYSPKGNDPRICFSQCANDWCSVRNTKKWNGALYFYYSTIINDEKKKWIFLSIMKNFKDKWKLVNSVSCN
jgi:hypothetical protein